jgi:hypothetical protein
LLLLTVLALLVACDETDPPTGSGGGRPDYPTTDAYTWRVHVTNPYFIQVAGNANDHIYALTRDNVIFHFDGVSWQYAMPFPDITCYAENYPLWVAPDGTVFIGCSDVVYRRDGGEWRTEQLADGAEVAGLWGTASNDVYAVGADGAGDDAGSAVFHFDGSAWSAVQHASANRLTAVTGIPSGHVYAAGEEGAFLHYDGSDWTASTAPTTRDFTSVWAASDALVVAAGDVGTIIRYDGTSFTAMTSGTTWRINAVWGNGPNDIYAGGRVFNILHYDGTSWGETEDPGDWVNALWGSPDGTIYAGTHTDGIRRYDGSSWSTAFTMPRRGMYAVWGAGHNDVYTVGTAVFHYDGTSWSEAAARPDGAGFSEALGGASSSDVWVMWSGGKIQHYDGSAWSEEPNNTGVDWLGDVWAAAPDDAYAVGGNRMIHWDGAAWSIVDAVKDAYLEAVDGAGPDCVFAVGGRGDVRVFTDGKWRKEHTLVDAWLRDVTVVDANTAYIAMQDDGMLVYERRRWRVVETPVYFSSIWAPAEDEVFGVQYRVGDVYRWNGSIWELVPRATRFTFQGAIWGHSRDGFWLVGRGELDGLIIEYQLSP